MSSCDCFPGIGGCDGASTSGMKGIANAAPLYTAVGALGYSRDECPASSSSSDEEEEEEEEEVSGTRGGGQSERRGRASGSRYSLGGASCAVLLLLSSVQTDTTRTCERGRSEERGV
jgi:hypothetical protein